MELWSPVCVVIVDIIGDPQMTWGELAQRGVSNITLSHVSVT